MPSCLSQRCSTCFPAAGQESGRHLRRKTLTPKHNSAPITRHGQRQQKPNDSACAWTKSKTASDLHNSNEVTSISRLTLSSVRNLMLLTARSLSENTSVKFRLSFAAVICSSSSRASMSTSLRGMSRFTVLMYPSVETARQSKGSGPVHSFCCALTQASEAWHHRHARRPKK